MTDRMDFFQQGSAGDKGLEGKAGADGPRVSGINIGPLPGILPTLSDICVFVV